MSEWLNGIYNDFYRSVIYDERYKLILEGLGNTIIIAIIRCKNTKNIRYNPHYFK